MEEEETKATIVYDNEVKSGKLKAGWGFSCLIETKEAPSILFDTGADSPTLLHNMKELDIDPKRVGKIVISHTHGDHTGGLRGMLEVNKEAEIYVPASFWGTIPGRKVTTVTGPLQISDGVFSTGELRGIEQSLAIRTSRGILIVVGCSHPGLGEIMNAGSRFGKLIGIAGGFHGFHDFGLFEKLSIIYPCHCTQYKREILDLFPGKAFRCGAGLVIEL
jgi:7,8-dihydropterin-6-yl-methyl-4-(beta-D-ribofuranosyl)aminobenzene 5'-phosphate synthase